MEVIICTPAQSGRLVRQNCQKSNPVQGQDKGDYQQNKNNLPDVKIGVRHYKSSDKKSKKQNSINNLIRFSQTSLGVGGFVAFFLFASFFSNLDQASAASSLSANLELAQRVINNINPVITENKVDAKEATLVFASEGYLNKPLVVETQVTRETVRLQTNSSKNTLQKNYSKNTTAKVASTGTDAHYFPYGYCTYYAAQRRFVPWSGNAITWLSGAQSFGFATGNTPQVGAIIVTSEGGKTGHVGIVDGVQGDQITITEMNYRGFGVISSRTISAGYGPIMGYIY